MYVAGIGTLTTSVSNALTRYSHKTATGPADAFNKCPRCGLRLTRRRKIKQD